MTENKRDPHNQREELLAAMTLPCRKTMLALAGTPEDAATWHNKLADLRAGLKVGIEVMEATARIKAQQAAKILPDDATASKALMVEANAAMQGAMYALGPATALECCMNAITLMHPELTIRVNVTKEPDNKNGDGNRIRHLDLDGPAGIAP